MVICACLIQIQGKGKRSRLVEWFDVAATTLGEYLFMNSINTFYVDSDLKGLYEFLGKWLVHGRFGLIRC